MNDKKNLLRDKALLAEIKYLIRESSTFPSVIFFRSVWGWYTKSLLEKNEADFCNYLRGIFSDDMSASWHTGVLDGSSKPSLSSNCTQCIESHWSSLKKLGTPLKKANYEAVFREITKIVSVFCIEPSSDVAYPLSYIQGTQLSEKDHEGVQHRAFSLSTLVNEYHLHTTDFIKAIDFKSFSQARLVRKQPKSIAVDSFPDHILSDMVELLLFTTDDVLERMGILERGDGGLSLQTGKLFAILKNYVLLLSSDEQCYCSCSRFSLHSVCVHQLYGKWLDNDPRLAELLAPVEVKKRTQIAAPKLGKTKLGACVLEHHVNVLKAPSSHFQDLLTSVNWLHARTLTKKDVVKYKIDDVLLGLEGRVSSGPVHEKARVVYQSLPHKQQRESIFKGFCQVTYDDGPVYAIVHDQGAEVMADERKRFRLLCDTGEDYATKRDLEDGFDPNIVFPVEVPQDVADRLHKKARTAS